MQITADLDSSHYDKLATLQTQLNQDIPMLLQLAIDDLYEVFLQPLNLVTRQETLKIEII